MKKLNGGSSRRELKETNCEIETSELVTFVTFKVKLSAVTLEWSKEILFEQQLFADSWELLLHQHLIGNFWWCIGQCYGIHLSFS